METGLRPTDGCEWFGKRNPDRYGTDKASYSELPPTRWMQLSEQKRKRKTEDKRSYYCEWEADEPNER
jgi:hypothetical protein